MLENSVWRLECELDGSIIAVAIGGADDLIARYYAELSLVAKSNVAVPVERKFVKQCALCKCIS